MLLQKALLIKIKCEYENTGLLASFIVGIGQTHPSPLVSVHRGWVAVVIITSSYANSSEDIFTLRYVGSLRCKYWLCFLLSTCGLCFIFVNPPLRKLVDSCGSHALFRAMTLAPVFKSLWTHVWDFAQWLILELSFIEFTKWHSFILGIHLFLCTAQPFDTNMAWDLRVSRNIQMTIDSSVVIFIHPWKCHNRLRKMI